MDTDGMRVICDDRLVTVVIDYLHAMEQDDLAALKGLLHADVELTHANFPPVRGRQATLDLLRGQRQLIETVDFTVRSVVGGGTLVLVEWVNLITLKSGSKARIPQVTALEFDDRHLITQIRIYADIADLFIALGRQRETSAVVSRPAPS